MTKQSGPPKSKRPVTPSNDAVRIATSLGSAYCKTSETKSGRETLTTATVEAVIHERALRSAYVPGELLTDPAWDMLLELLHVELEGRQVAVAVLCKAAGVSQSTGLRWINVMVSKGLCIKADSVDPQNVLVRLSEKGSQAMRDYFGALSE